MRGNIIRWLLRLAFLVLLVVLCRHVGCVGRNWMLAVWFATTGNFTRGLHSISLPVLCWFNVAHKLVAHILSLCGLLWVLLGYIEMVSHGWRGFFWDQGCCFWYPVVKHKKISKVYSKSPRFQQEDWWWNVIHRGFLSSVLHPGDDFLFESFQEKTLNNSPSL